VSGERNILLLGVTGVGKSTFINAFRNYLEYDSLYAALKDPMPTRFAVLGSFDVEEEMKANGYYTRKRQKPTRFDPSRGTFIVGDESYSERFSKTGRSSTRSSNIYSFTVDDLVINLINTPGIGDTAGRSQDQKNIRNILERLESIDKLSVILFLFKQDKPRLTEAFSYYISELVRHLHVDASKNVLFGFTKSAYSNWYLGAAKVHLDAALDQLGLKGNPYSNTDPHPRTPARFCHPVGDTVAGSRGCRRCGGTGPILGWRGRQTS
jgi:GTPase SAR1 family protein